MRPAGRRSRELSERIGRAGWIGPWHLEALLLETSAELRLLEWLIDLVVTSRGPAAAAIAALEHRHVRGH